MKKLRSLAGNRTVLSIKIKEAFTSVMPIAVIVMILCFTLTPIDSGILLSFILGTVLVIIGMGLFTLGADTAMTPIGEYIGDSTVKTKKIAVIIPIFFVLGVFITISEPDLSVLAKQLSGTINSWILILSVGVGVGLFLVIAFLRIVFKIKLKYLLLIFYGIIFILAFFMPEVFLPLSFDAGGVTTGPMSVPFIMAIGTGIAMIRSDHGAKDDSFGLTALCSIGPILAVMILGVVYKPDSIEITAYQLTFGSDSRTVFMAFVRQIPEYLKEVGVALLPIVLFFFIFQLFGKKVGRNQNIKIAVGLVNTFLGLVLFLLGVNVGFLPIGNYLGTLIGAHEYRFIAVPIGMLLGFFVVAAEPAVHVLTKQVYEITSGGIPKSALSLSLMLGVSVSVGLAMLRILLHIPILYFLIPFYLIALGLTFVVPDIFTAVAFDSGGVASGAMTTSFILPFALGICEAVGGNIATEGFGVVAMVAMTPLVAIQILGLIYKLQLSKHKKEKAGQSASDSEEIIG